MREVHEWDLVGRCATETPRPWPRLAGACGAGSGGSIRLRAGLGLFLAGGISGGASLRMTFVVSWYSGARARLFRRPAGDEEDIRYGRLTMGIWSGAARPKPVAPGPAPQENLSRGKPKLQSNDPTKHATYPPLTANKVGSVEAQI